MRIITQVSKPPSKKFNFLPPKDIWCIDKNFFRHVPLGNAFLYKHYLINVIGGDEGEFNNSALSGPLERTGGHIGLINPQQNVLHLFLFLEHASCKIQLRNDLCYIHIFTTCAIFLFLKTTMNKECQRKVLFLLAWMSLTFTLRLLISALSWLLLGLHLSLSEK